LARFLALGLLLLICLMAAAPLFAGEAVKPRSAAEKGAEGEIARYCGNIAPSAAEARLAWQMKKLAELETRARQAFDDLSRREDATREWVVKRDQMVKAATDDLVAIYSKMSAESAAAQLSSVDDNVAASVLMKLKPQAAASILNEMDVEHASHLSNMIAGGAFGAGKS
jgi:flagellar motility protein MotE (MotC chaperone)